MCRERVEAVVANLCAVSGDDDIAAGELLVAVRFKHGMSQSEIARAEGLSRQAVSKRIQRSKYLQRLQVVSRKQKVQLRELRAAKVYRMYMVECLPVLEIERQIKKIHHCVTGIAREYAEEHGLPFVARGKGPGMRWRRRKTKEDK